MQKEPWVDPMDDYGIVDAPCFEIGKRIKRKSEEKEKLYWRDVYLQISSNLLS